MSSQEALELLRRNPVFARVPSDVLGELAAASTVRHYQPRDVVTRSGTHQTHVMLIAEGCVELWQRHAGRDLEIFYGSLRAPGVLGDTEMFAKSAWTSSSRATEPTSVVAMPNQALERAVRRDGSLAAGMYRDACTRHYLVIRIVETMALQRAQERILAFLWEQSRPMDGVEVRRRVQLSPVRVAKALGLDRKTVFRCVRELERQDLLVREPNAHALISPPANGQPPTQIGEHGFGASWRFAERGRA
jgi:CRP-like cAMP-binding protein